MSEIKIAVRGIYDLQKLRIQMGNRLVGQFKSKLGQLPGMSEKEIEKEAEDYLKELRKSFKKITDGVTQLPTPSKFKGDAIISTYAEFVLTKQYLEMESREQAQFRTLEWLLSDYPIYASFLEPIRGIGPAISAIIIAEFDIHKAEYPSSLWKYAGLDVAGDGKGRSKREEHLIDVEYLDTNKELKTRKGITFNPFLKTKLIGVMGSSFIRQSPDKCVYRKIYDDYKNRLENHPAHVDKSKGHRHNMAIRYCVKRFLVDLYYAWRKLENLPVAKEYSEAKLGIIHKAA
jgi:hypothetical protein